MKKIEQEVSDQISKTNNRYQHVYSEALAGAFLYGAGFIGRWSANYLESIGIRVLGFIDSDSSKWGNRISGINVFSPNELKNNKSKVVFITSRHAVPEVSDYLETFENPFISIDEFVVHYQGEETIEQVRTLFGKISLDSPAIIEPVLMLGFLSKRRKPIEKEVY